VFWKKKEPQTPTLLKSDEYAELHGKVSKLLVKVDDLDNRLMLVDTIAKSNRARINHIKVDKVLSDEIEKDKKKDDINFL
jgi:hypothetical protein